MEEKESQQYESPEIVDYGDIAELTQHQMHGDPHDFPFHGSDPHMTFSKLSVMPQAALRPGGPGCGAAHTQAATHRVSPSGAEKCGERRQPAPTFGRFKWPTPLIGGR